MSAGIGLFELLIVVGIGFFLATLIARWSAKHTQRRRNDFDEYAHDASSDSSWLHSSSTADHSASATWFGANANYDSSGGHDSGGFSDSGSSGDCGGGDSGGGCSSGGD